MKTPAQTFFLPLTSIAWRLSFNRSLQASLRLLLPAWASAILLTSCDRSPPSTTVAQGTIASVEYRLEEGGTGGFTRLNLPDAVPGGNGSWNIDAEGRLTKDFLFVTRPQRSDLGLLVIPTSRLVEVRFGDAGIAEVDESNPQ